MRLVILTSDSLRHSCLKKAISIQKNVNVVKTFCEKKEKKFNANLLSILQVKHIEARTKSERDFFEPFVKIIPDYSNTTMIEDGEINDEKIVSEICNLNPDLIIAYGCSIIRSRILSIFQNRIINVHLGLSPYYRGSGTNFFPFVNNELEFVGVTFMYMDNGIDTGDIIHQIQADFFEEDNIHAINNRLIWKMIFTLIKIIEILKKDFTLKTLKQSKNKSNGKLYKKSDFNDDSIIKMFENFRNNMIGNYIKNKTKIKIFENPLLIKDMQ